jgi:hypothetical protein
MMQHLSYRVSGCIAFTVSLIWFSFCIIWKCAGWKSDRFFLEFSYPQMFACNMLRCFSKLVPTISIMISYLEF